MPRASVVLASIPLYKRYHSKLFAPVGHETTYAANENHHFVHSSMSSSDLPRLLRASVKPVHRKQLCTSFTEVINNNNSGRSDSDIFSEKMMISYRAVNVHVFMPILQKLFEWYLLYNFVTIIHATSKQFQKNIFSHRPQLKQI